MFDYFNLAAEKGYTEKINLYFKELNDSLLNEKIKSEVYCKNVLDEFKSVKNKVLMDFWNFEQTKVKEHGGKLIAIFERFFEKINLVKIQNQEKLNFLICISNLFDEIFKNIAIIDFDIFIQYINTKKLCFTKFNNKISPEQSNLQSTQNTNDVIMDIPNDFAHSDYQETLKIVDDIKLNVSKIGNLLTEKNNTMI